MTINIVCNYMNYRRYNCRFYSICKYVNKLLVYLFVMVLFIDLCSTVNNFTPRGLQIGLALLANGFTLLNKYVLTNPGYLVIAGLSEPDPPGSGWLLPSRTLRLPANLINGKTTHSGTDCARPFYEGVKRMVIYIYMYDNTPVKGAWISYSRSKSQW